MKEEKTLGTYDFVRATGRDLYFEARDREIALLQGPDGGIRPEFAEPVTACPVCGGDRFELWFVKQGFAIRRCLDGECCGHVFADPQIKEDVLREAYRGTGSDEASGRSANDLWIEVLLSEANQSYDRSKFQHGVKAIEAALLTERSGRPRVLDIGCSIGHFLEVAREAGWDAVGLELNRKAVAHAREVLGLDVREQVLEEAGFAPATFDAVTMWGVIEHLKRPVETLREIVPLLKPGGVFLTFSPNGASLVCHVLRDQAATFDGRNHPSYFTPRSISLALELAGFQNLSVSYFQPDLDALVNYCEGRDPYIKKAERFGPLYGFLAQTHRREAEEFILAHGLGYKMMTVSLKPRP
ncbi:MAG: class I SAM-dependent methyltransferase [Thermodesulfobacteriota bacterium]